MFNAQRANETTFSQIGPSFSRARSKFPVSVVTITASMPQNNHYFIMNTKHPLPAYLLLGSPTEIKKASWRSTPVCYNRIRAYYPYKKEVYLIVLDSSYYRSTIGLS